MKKAIISVSDKTNLPILIDFLLSQDYSIISTGGTYKFILNYVKKKDKDRIISVSDFTGFPEVLGGRVKTLHPKIYSGILFDPNKIISETVTVPLAISSIKGCMPLNTNVCTSDKIVFPRSALWRFKNQL